MTFVPPPPPPVPPGGAPRARRTGDRRVMWIILIAVGVVVGVPFVLGIVAAIAIPGLLRARMSANEAAAIAAMRTVASQRAMSPDVPVREGRNGYEFRFDRRPGGGGFVYRAWPTAPASTGNRRFCVDERGVVLQYRLDDAWTDPSPPEASCPPAGIPVDSPGR